MSLKSYILCVCILREMGGGIGWWLVGWWVGPVLSIMGGRGWPRGAYETDENETRDLPGVRITGTGLGEEDGCAAGCRLVGFGRGRVGCIT